MRRSCLSFLRRDLAWCFRAARDSAGQVRRGRRDWLRSYEVSDAHPSNRCDWFDQYGSGGGVRTGAAAWGDDQGWGFGDVSRGEGGESGGGGGAAGGGCLYGGAGWG